MGSRWTYKCKCGYSAVVSGMPDMSFFAKTISAVCDDCNEIGDIITETEKKEWKADIGKCHECGSSNVRGWGQKDRYEKGDEDRYDCPKCGGTMEIDLNAGQIMYD